MFTGLLAVDKKTKRTLALPLGVDEQVDNAMSKPRRVKGPWEPVQAVEGA